MSAAVVALRTWELWGDGAATAPVRRPA